MLHRRHQPNRPAVKRRKRSIRLWSERVSIHMLDKKARVWRQVKRYCFVSYSAIVQT